MNIFHIFTHKKQQKETLFRNFVFGVEDSLVSTVGLLAGVASGGIVGKSIVTTGIVLIFVEAFSMGIGSFLTEEATEELDGGVSNQWEAAKGALTMFGSYLLAGFIPLAPYIFAPNDQAVIYSVASSLIGLAVLGYSSAKIFRYGYPMHRAIKVALLGGVAVMIGMLVGRIFQV